VTVIEHDSDLTEGADLDFQDGRTLPGHRAQITMDDGQVYLVRITNREYVAWDKTAPRKKWGSAKEVPFLASTFMAWAAARREGVPPGLLSFEVFQERAEEVKDQEQEEEDIARPTQRAAGPGSS
jgi:hypothetical protein